jgi:predicted homoserine dehydrogenase-like protein
MILVDSALQQREREGRPIRVAMIGAGFMGRGIALQISRYTPGVRLVAIYNRSLDGARRAYREAGIDDVLEVASTAALESSIEAGRYAITEDPSIVCAAGHIDAVIEVTGTIELGARVVLEAIEHGKHVILMNAELDGTVGPILKRYADRAGVVYTNADGDQPGVIMNLYRFVKGIGVRPVLCGNIKGLQDPYRNPTTQQGFAQKWGQKAHMVTSFADGTKISFEQAIVANATGMGVARRGMLGPTVPAGTPLREAVKQYPEDLLLGSDGIVDYVVGAEPSPGVFVLGTHDDPIQKHYLNLYKLGEGPLYCFYTPYHLCHFEIAATVARAVLFKDATIAPLGSPWVEVVATAKIDLEAGQALDGMGHYMTYGQAENANVCRTQRLLPIGIAEGARLKRDIKRDAVLTIDDVELPTGRLCDRLRSEQDIAFGTPAAGAARAVGGSAHG